MKSPTLGQYYSTKNILLQFWWKALLLVNPTVLEIFCCSFDEKSYSWSILCTSFGKSYSTRNILPRLVHPRKCWWQYRAISTTFEPLTSTKRLSTVSSPYMVFILSYFIFIFISLADLDRKNIEHQETVNQVKKLTQQFNIQSTPSKKKDKPHTAFFM